MDRTADTSHGPADGTAAYGPRLVFFGVTGRRDLAQSAAAAAPGVRFSSRREWAEDPGEPRRRLLGGAPAVGLWYWADSREEFEAQACDVLLRLVHPLVGRGLPFCLGFPFEPEVLEPRRLTVAEAARLDLEDIGRLLRAASLGRGAVDGPPASAGPGASSSQSGLSGHRAAPRRSAGGPDAVRLDDAQLAAVEHARGPARVLAPAGSGKTKTLISRVVELVDRGADPAGVLMLAFNRKAAEQLEERLATLGIASTRRIGTPAESPGPGGRPRPGRRSSPGSGLAPACASPAPQVAPAERPAGVHCATFNAFGYRYQREVLRARIQLDHDGRSLRAIMARAMETAGVSLRDLKPRRGSDPVGAFLEALTSVRAALAPPDEVQVRIESLGDSPLLDIPFGAVHAQFSRAQAATGVQSFDDQIYFAVADMLADPAHRAFIQARFDHVLVDEFQDLNGAQLALVDVLSRPHRRLFVVGDDDQLIYGWRQADPRGILEFHRRMPPRPWSATYTLCTNYRCSRAVVETGARLVRNNVVREAKDIRPRPGAQDGEVRFFGSPSWPERAAEMCSFLRREKQRLGSGWRDLAVLCRYRSQQLLVALALDAGDVPRTPALGCTLFTHPAAMLLRAYLCLVRVPDELPGRALAALLNRPNRFVNARDTESVATAARPWSRLKALATEEPAAGPRPLSRLVEQAATLAVTLAPPDSTAAESPSGDLPARGDQTSDGGQPPSSLDAVWAAVETFGLDGLWAAETDAAAAGGAGPDGAGPLEVFDSLLLLAETYPDLAVYLDVWDRLRMDEEAHGEADEEHADNEPDHDRVVIGTIHAAKGREYDSIVIPDYDCDVSRWSASEVEEERRVVYVGVTRARDAALFTVDTSTGFVHPFLRELVEAPDPGEHETLCAWLEEVGSADEARGEDRGEAGGAGTAGGAGEPPDERTSSGAAQPGVAQSSAAQPAALADHSAALRRLIAARLSEIEVLYPELVPERQSTAQGTQCRDA